MNEQAIILAELIKKKIASTTSVTELLALQNEYFGKNGEFSKLLRQISNLELSLRKEAGETLNKIKNELSDLILTKKNLLLEESFLLESTKNWLDVSINEKHLLTGSLHPITQTIRRTIAIFNQFGFEVAFGPEIENLYYNFTALNIPANHPALTMQDTFYTSTDHVLRTHTSPVQIRFMEKNSPPIRVIAPGKVYRVDMDATHSPMFHQIEGLWIDETVTFANLKYIIIKFLRIFFELPDLQIRFRNSFFPFTEPSAEIDIQNSNGDWLEVAGCGMVHPNVLTAMNLDNTKVQGFAFGIGLDRLTMLYYQIKDLRLLFENDLDYLQQFNF